MTNRQQPDALRLADELEEPLHDFPEPTTLEAEAAAELRRLHAENETLRAKLKTYEDLGDAGSDVQLLRMGYAAARLEIESLRDEVKEYRHAAGVQKTLIETLLAEKPAGAPQPGAAYAALPEPITYQIAVLKACEHGDALVGWRVEPSRQSFDASMRPKRKLYTEGDMHDFADRTHALRASHGQAPAQAAPAAVAGPSEDVQRARHIASVAQRWIGDRTHLGALVYLDDLAWALKTLAAAPTTQPAPQQAAQEPVLYDPKALLSIFQNAQAGSSSAAGTLRGIAAVIASWESRAEPHTWLIAAPQPSPAAQGDALDAARWHWLAEYLVGPRTDLDDAIVASETVDDLKKLVDAARAAQEGK